MQEIAKFVYIALFSLLITSCAGLGAKDREQLQTLSDQALQTIKEVEERIAQNPETALVDSLKVLNEVLNYAEAVRADSARFDQKQIQNHFERIKIINENIKRFKDLTLKADVSFPIGTYNLSEKGKEECRKLTSKVIDTVHELQTRYPDYSIRITLKTIGYTDEVRVIGKSFKKRLRSHMQDAAKKTKVTRQDYNRILSRLRAQSVSDYLVEHLTDHIPQSTDVKYVNKVIGRGEKYPQQGITPPYKSHDERRRICFISPYIEILL